jgi:epoxyqueuosine reductase QueG
MMTAMDLRKMAAELGAAAFGVADLEALRKQATDLLKNVPGNFTRAVVAGVRLQDAVVEGIEDHPTALYFHNYRQANYELDRMAFKLAAKIQEAGYKALAVPASQIVKSNPMQGHISHKLLGWAAGIGFIGRQTLLVHPEYGARMRYVSVLTDMPLEADKPYTGEGCGSCRACIAVCPAGAIREDRKDFDLDACYRKLTEFTRLPFIGQHICGVCVKACSAGARRGGEKRQGNHG